jgi:ABC-2 type transport system permease protein
MSVIAVPDTTPAISRLDRPDPGRGQVFGNSLRFEWTKLRTVRSTWWTLVAAVVAMVGIAILGSAFTVHDWATTTPADRLLFDPLETSARGAFFAQLAMGVLGVLVITTEYGTGLIRSTFAAVPQRATLLAAKALVLFAVTLVVGIVASLLAFFTAQTILGRSTEAHLSVSITGSGAVQTVLGAGLFLAMMALLGCAIGALVRRSAGAITALFGLNFLLPVFAQLLPATLRNNMVKYLPSEAGSAMYRHVQQPGALSPLAGLIVLGSYTLIGLCGAAVVLRRRDA